MTHYIKQCPICRKIHEQCRCPGNKTTTLVPCSNCSLAAKSVVPAIMENWVNCLWGMWEEAIKVGNRPMNLDTMYQAFEAAFYAGRESTELFPKKKIRKS